jgi:hypothetical protein
MSLNHAAVEGSDKDDDNFQNNLFTVVNNFKFSLCI